ncbi:RNA-directed DNA polymerase from mobile element jockey [Trichonephila clavipes]|nr:RNA-directed DNA polymerase from mobile element jockey [Trichonephila clavipes]
MLEPRAPNTHGNTLCNWASAHALDIMAPTIPTYYAARGACSILHIAFSKNLTLVDITSVSGLSSDHNPVLIVLALNNSFPKNLRTLMSTYWVKFQEIVFNSIPEDNSLYNLQRKLVKKPVIITPLAGRKGILYSDDEKAEEFKKNLEATFQENPEPYNDTIIELVESETYDFLSNSTMQVPLLTSPTEISNSISKLQNKKASGPDNIPNYALKLLPLNAITHLTKIINTCLKHRYFPTLWKSANVIMLPKPNQNHKLVNNYRPISLLCAMAKIYEKVILNRIKQHCDTINSPRSKLKRPPVGVVWYLRERGASSGVVHVTWSWFKITWSVAKSPCVAEQCDVNIQSSSSSSRRLPCFLQFDWPKPVASQKVGVEMDWVDPKINDPRQGDLE